MVIRDSSTIFHCLDCGESFPLLESCPACDQTATAPPPLTLTKEGWRQPRIDGTTWMIDRSANGVLIPVGSESKPRGVLETCEKGHRYRLAQGVTCPECQPTTHDGEASGSGSEGDTYVEKPKRSQAIPWLVAAVIVMAVVTGVLLDMNGPSSDQGPSAPPASTATTTQLSPTTTLARATTTVNDPDQGWTVGACVEFIGEFAEPVACSRPHDAEVIDVVASEVDCPGRTEWLVEIDNGVACLVET